MPLKSSDQNLATLEYYRLFFFGISCKHSLNASWVETPHKSDRKEGLKSENWSVLQQHTTQNIRKKWDKKAPYNYQNNDKENILTAVI